MNLWLRLLWLLVTTRFRPALAAPFGVSVVPMIVLPNDLDVNLHVNNGHYLTIMDLGPLDLFIHGAGWRPVLSAAKIRFRREMRLWRRFRIETRVVFWEHTTFVMEHRIIMRDKGGRDVEAARSLNRGGVHDPKASRFVTVAELFKLMNIDVPSPPASDEVRAFLFAEEALKRAI